MNTAHLINNARLVSPIVCKYSKYFPIRSYLFLCGSFGLKVGLVCLSVGQDSDGEDSDPDLFQCGKCKQMFTSLQKYLKHKAAKDCSVQLQGNRTVISPVTNGEVRIKTGSVGQFRFLMHFSLNTTPPPFSPV